MKIIHLDDISEVGVRHNEAIKKKVLLEKGTIPHLMTFAQATFQPGQSVEMHSHETMYEVFYILAGKAEFVVNSETLVVQPGDCVVVEPCELHAQTNPFEENVTWLYFGIATEERSSSAPQIDLQ